MAIEDVFGRNSDHEGTQEGAQFGEGTEDQQKLCMLLMVTAKVWARTRLRWMSREGYSIRRTRGWIEKRNRIWPAIAEMVEHAMADDEGLQEEVPHRTVQIWTAKGLRGDPRGQIFAGASVHRRTSRRNPASGNMAGRIGLLPSPTPISGRLPCCQARLSRTGTHLRSHSGRNAGVALAHAPTVPEFSIPHMCSASVCWSAHAPSRRQRAAGAMLSWTHEESTEQHAHSQGGSENLPIPLNAFGACLAQMSLTV